MKRLTFFLINFFTVFAVIGHSNLFASESDPYTYADIELKDASDDISALTNNMILNAVSLTNNFLSEQSVELESRTDTRILSWFFVAWQEVDLNKIEIKYNSLIKKYFYKLGTYFMELCLYRNPVLDCEPLNNVERINIPRGKSVYDLANYDLIAQSFLAPIINLCGNRVGADKLTHFFSDGYGFFRLVINESISMEQVKDYSFYEEMSGNGAKVTGVVSSADVQANLSGVQFYKDLFLGDNPMLGLGKNRYIVVNRDFDICDYKVDEWDETNPKFQNEYVGENAQQLANIITERKLDPNPENLSKLEILSGKHRIERYSVRMIRKLISSWWTYRGDKKTIRRRIKQSISEQLNDETSIFLIGAKGKSFGQELQNIKVKQFDIEEGVTGF